ncbi:MAG: hypothetical protein WCD87_26065 [Pseudolabrys sp.]
MAGTILGLAGLMHDRHRAGLDHRRPALSFGPDGARLISKRGQYATMQINYKTIATFCEHTAEMLEGVSDNAELIKRHRDSLERLRDGLARLLEG